MECPECSNIMEQICMCGTNEEIYIDYHCPNCGCAATFKWIPRQKNEVKIMLNRVVLIGRLTAEPTLRYTPNGVAVANFILAVNRSRLNQAGEREADFIPIVVWQKQAENCAEYIGKGSPVAVDGRIQVRTYDTKAGERRWITEVIAENVRFLDKRGDNNSNQESNSFGHEVQFSDEDIPF